MLNKNVLQFVDQKLKNAAKRLRQGRMTNQEWQKELSKASVRKLEAKFKVTQEQQEQQDVVVNTPVVLSKARTGWGHQNIWTAK